MVYDNQSHSGEFSKRTTMIVCAPVYKIMCPEPGRDQNNLPHTVKIMVYIHIMFGHLFGNSVKTVTGFLTTV